jgi:biotin transport system substrate-specific component
VGGLGLSIDVDDISYASVFGALTAIGAWISIPIGQVPITLQVLFIVLSGFLLGVKRGFLSQIVYLSAGALGLPVFAKFTGGISAFYGPTAGYLLAFPIAAAIAGLSAGRKRLSAYLITGFLAIGAVYLLGWARLVLLLNSPEKALEVGVIPFLPIDTIKVVVAALIAVKMRRITVLS